MTAYEDKLSAFLDGELSADETREIEEALARDPSLQAELEALMDADAAAQAAFAEDLEDPVPFEMAAAIRNADVTPAANADVAPASRFGWLSVAATVVALLFGGVIGYVGGQSQGVQVAAAPGWLADIADYHRVYASQKRHLVEVGADEAAHIETWLSNTVGAPIRIADLSDQGLTFQGARLLVAAGKPVAQLMYTDAQDRVVALCVIRSETPQQGFSERTIDAFEMVSWGGEMSNFVVVGDSDRSDLQTIADAAATQV